MLSTDKIKRLKGETGDNCNPESNIRLRKLSVNNSQREGRNSVHATNGMPIEKNFPKLFKEEDDYAEKASFMQQIALNEMKSQAQVSDVFFQHIIVT